MQGDSQIFYIFNLSYFGQENFIFWGKLSKLLKIQVDITWFPFDDQDCDLKFGSWTYSGWKVKTNTLFIDVLKI